MAELITDPGVQVAPGDPDSIAAAANAHAQLADTMQTHGATISGTAATLGAAWQSEAAHSYQALSSFVSSHFYVASDEVRFASQILRRYEGELREYQSQGKAALADAIHWMNEANEAAAALEQAQQAANTAQASLNTADAGLRALRAAVPGSDVNSARTTFGNEATSAGSALSAADAEVAKWTAKLDHAKTELTQAQQKGHQAWQSAEDAAQAATGGLSSINIAAPPFAGAAPSGSEVDGVLAAFASYTQNHAAEAVWGTVEGAARRYRVGKLLVAGDEESEQAMQTLGEEIKANYADGDNFYYDDTSGLYLPKGGTLDPLVAKVEEVAESDGMKTITERWFVAEEESLLASAPEWAQYAGKGMGAVAVAYTGWETATDEWAEDSAKGYSTAHKVVDTTIVTGATIGGTLAGAEGGAEVGGAIGTAVGGPVGTVVGGLVGGVAGGVIGSSAGKAVGHLISGGVSSVAHFFGL